MIPTEKNIRPKDLVLRFMDSMGHKKDAEAYLKIFTSTQPESFAIVVIDESVLQEEIDAIIFDLRYLMRLELYPVILTVASNAALKESGMETYFRKSNLAKALLPSGLQQSEKLAFVKESIKNKRLPVFHLENHSHLLDDLVSLADILKTGKIIFLSQVGSIIDQHTQNQISIINLRFDKNELIKHQQVNDSDIAFLNFCEKVILKCSHKIFISLVSPLNLIRELFTVKGAGTLIQVGSKILTFKNWQDIHTQKLTTLLEMSFRKIIKKDFFNQAIDYFYIEENYLGAALLKQHEDMFYLSKFAVGTEARGLGIGRDLWSEILKNHQKIFWRSSAHNFITSWYQKQCDGMHQTKDWIVFWKGIDQKDITTAINYAIAQPTDFMATPHTEEIHS